MNINDLLPLLAAIIGLTPVFLKWFNDRSKEAATHRKIQHSKEQVEFLQTWLQAQREVTGDERFAELKKEVSERLDKLMELNVELENNQIKEEENEDELSFIQKIFLAYLPRTASGWIFHTLFYATVSFTFLMLWGASVPEEKGENTLTQWEQLKNEISGNLSLFIFLFVLAIVFQQLARRIEKRRTKKTQAKES